VFIDGYGGLVESAIGPERLTRFIRSLVNELRALGAMVLVSMESRNILEPTMQLPGNGLVSLLEGLILMRYAEIEGRLRRLISVAKMRDSDFDPYLHEFRMTAGGIEVSGRFAGFEAVLSGFGRESRSTHEGDPKWIAP
jgi:circadian clock protein KaiC